jgi:lysozyme family protein
MKTNLSQHPSQQDLKLMTSLFDKIIPVILKNEGGFQNDPDDIGNYTPEGKLKGTKYDIAAKYFPEEDIKNLTKERAKEIYHESFWKPMNLEGIKNENLVLHIFDHGVNAGKENAIKMIQKIVEVVQDGIIGPITTKAINEFKSRSTVIQGYGLLYSLLDYYVYARHEYYTQLTIRRPITKKYIKGWFNRINNCIFENA